MTFSPIAICGYSCKLPGDATDADSFWNMCLEGRNAWSAIPESRFSRKAFYNERQGEPGTTNVLGGYFLKEDIYAFDAPFFNMSVEVATSMDPAIRLQLESVHEALEQAGITLADVAGTRTSVFSGSFHRDYHDNLSHNPDELPRHLLTGTGTAMLSNRISHFFDLRGPSMTIDTGCSSSLTSLHSACLSLQSGDCDMSLVTGCNVLLSPDPFISMSGLGLLGPSGRSYAFDKRAEGYGRGEGVVTLVIKTLARAKADGDTIHAIIRGSAINQDGKTSTITSPSQEAQETVISKCYEAARLNPLDTAFVECHGTGTKVGDRCEASAIHNAFHTERRESLLYLGSAKSNVGHLEAASGLASIIKVIQAMQHGIIPPICDFVEPNPAIAWDEWKLTVPQDPVPWPSGFAKRASINSFGYGGSNAHVILEAHNMTTATHVNGHTKSNGVDAVGARLFCVSGNDALSCTTAKSRLLAYAQKLQRPNASDENEVLSTLSYKLAHERTHFRWRTAIQASSITELTEGLASMESKPVLSANGPSLGFVFTGQGAHWVGMGKELIDKYPVFQGALRQLDQCMVDLGASWSIIDELRRDSSMSRLEQAEYSMPVCCALQIALVILLRSWNIIPSAVSGHSSGESAAAFAAGALDMHSALAVQYYRGLLSSASEGKANVKGAMLAAGLSPEEARKRIEAITCGKVVIGCYNSPSSVTLSGDEEGILEAEKLIGAEGFFVRRLKVKNAFHSHHMEEDAAKYRQFLETSFSKDERKMKIPLASSVTGTWLTRSTDFGPEHWVNYMLLPVQFTEASTQLLTEQANIDSRSTVQRAIDIIVEIGPHSALSSPLKQTMKSLKVANVAYTSVLKRSENSMISITKLFGFLWSHGYPIDLSTVSHMEHHNFKSIVYPPSYAWNHTTSLSIMHPSEAAFKSRLHPKNLLIGTVQPTSDPKAPSWQRTGSIDVKSWPEVLYLGDMNLSPLPAFLSMAVMAIQQLASNLDEKTKNNSHPLIHLDDVHFNMAMDLPTRHMQVLFRTSLHDMQLSRSKDAGLARTFQVHCIQNANQWTLLCWGQISLHSTPHLQKAYEHWVVSQIGGVPIRLCGLPGEKGYDTGASAYVNVSTDEFSVVCQGRIPDFGEYSKSEAMMIYQKLALSFRTLASSRQALFVGACKGELESIERVAINLEPSSGTPPYYLAHIKASRANWRYSVTWNSSLDTELGTASSMQEVEMRGVCFTPRSVFINGVRTSLVCDSLTTVSNESLKDIPRHRLGGEEKGILTDLNTLCRGFFYQTLNALRLESPRRLLGHFASYVQFMKSIESTSASEWERLTHEEAVSLRARVISSSVNGQLVCRVGDQLTTIIHGEVDALEIMMENRLLHRYYEEGLRWTRSYEQLRSLIRILSLQHPRMNILEIGAGTGGATTSVLQALEDGELSADNVRCETYTYSDISAGFFSKAKEKFRRYNHAMTFKKLDIEKDLKGQSFEGQTYDLIVASQCLHATKNMRKTMANVKKLLKPGARLVMVETTKDQLDIQLFASCFRGWWLSEEPERKWSPSLSEGLWQQVLTDSGFSGIDFTVRDCEDNDLYAMQLILSTALHEPEIDEVRIITGDEQSAARVAHSVQKEVGRLYSVTPTTISQISQTHEGGLCVVVDTEGQLKLNLEGISQSIGLSKSAILATTRREDNVSVGSNTVSDDIHTILLKHTTSPIASITVNPEVDIYGNSTAVALSSLLKTPSERWDSHYQLESHGLKNFRAVPYTLSLARDSEEMSLGTPSLEPDNQYVIRGHSVSLVSAGCKLLVNLGARNIWAVLTRANDGSFESDLEKLQSDATMISETESCQIVVTTLGAKPEFNGKVAGIIDFGDVQENVDLRTTYRGPATSAMIQPLERTIVGNLEFHIRLVPIFDTLLPGWTPPTTGGVTTIYTGPISTVNAFAQGLLSSQGSQPVEIATIFIVLAELIRQSKTDSPGQTLYVGLPASLNADELSRLVATPHFRSLSPRLKGADVQGHDESESFHIVPSMSKKEKAAVILGAIVSYIADMFMLDRSEIDEKGSLSQYIDSLTATQLRTWILATFRATLKSEDISDSTSILVLADKVATAWKDST